ncbi:MAG: cytochrome c3 family protein [Myxococcales bacterium FL481]|nr:MAG: cytochrome c3 family protein [Myxococcales bacterium FL481]
MPAIFPRWINSVPIALALGFPAFVATVIGSVWYWASPKFTDAGYQPEQPVPFSHRLHAGEMGLDCRYCHNTVDRAAVAAIPPTKTCMNCHTLVKPDSEKLAPVRESAQTGESIKWSRVHMLPDYAYFDHGPHVAAGVGCNECHGRIDQMDVVEQKKPLSMHWCLECHRDFEPRLRPLDQVTNLGWSGHYDPRSDPNRERPVDELKPPLHCSGCHR